jgi:hypothetical protein
VKVALVIVVGSIASLKVALIVTLAGTVEAALAGFVLVIVGGVASGVKPVVKLQTKLAAIGMPVRSVAAVVIVAVS